MTILIMMRATSANVINTFASDFLNLFKSILILGFMEMTTNKKNTFNFTALVTIENKPYLRDPEGETILRDLITKGGYNNIIKVRSAKTLRITVTEKSRMQAQKLVQKLCEDLRIYNPVVSNCKVKVTRCST
jgi:phosphoribosylformylglycinamidine synthase subunit PurS